ncbi:MAG: bifunctional glutamate N-acetyltransferase/amino-acid acetyltransferase ArgJ [Rhizobiales bacterium]|nr:bifunctional glutamate N-acetyltransferase/amino-acid acetyltransferase ArgJ [Hyphomicrobiales bacterium]
MAGHLRSPLAPAALAELPAIAGVRLATGETGIRYKNRPDFLLAELTPGSSVAGVFTTSKSRSAPVDWCAASLKSGEARALVVNAGNANAFTGKAGVKTVTEVAGAAAKLFGARTTHIFQASTGVIGEPLDPAPLIKSMNEAKARLREDAWADAARAIMTTDTFAKAATVRARIGRSSVTINGIAKGSGMIAPDMATMLVFLFTDAKLPARVLQQLLSASTAKTFNCITVDGDTSTSDTVLLFASGRAGAVSPAIRNERDPRIKGFAKALDALCLDLAHQVVKDGEGAEKFIEITITGAESDKAARRIGMAIANSPLVKTAIAGEDANWGRIVMAIGKSGEKAERDRLRIMIGGVSVARNGMRDPTYNEAEIVPHMKGRSITIAADVGVGRGKATVWTCDLTHRYIDINGSYRS